jgi:ribosomal-protein-alanine N-acetyltransferase
MVIENEAHPEGIREDREIFLERIELYPDGFLVTVEAGQVVGYICSELWQVDKIEPSLFSLNKSIRSRHTFDGNTHYISSMAILKQAQSLGLGRSMFQALLDSVPVTKRVLIVGLDKTRAHRIYIDAGFEPLFAIKDFFTPVGQAPTSGLVLATKS